MIGYFESAPADQDLLAKPPAPRRGETSVKLPVVDPKLAELAKKAVQSQQAWDEFAAAVKKAVPKVDRVCLTYFIADKLRVEWSAYPGEVSSRFAETGFERPAVGFGLAMHALRGGVTYLPDLKQARGGDFQVISNTLGSSLHVAVIRDDGRPGTLNFWSKDKNGFDAATQGLLQAFAKAFAGRE